MRRRPAPAPPAGRVIDRPAVAGRPRRARRDSGAASASSPQLEDRQPVGLEHETGALVQAERAALSSCVSTRASWAPTGAASAVRRRAARRRRPAPAPRRDREALDVAALARPAAHGVAHDAAPVAGDLEVHHRRGGERLGEPGLVEAPERGEGGPVDGERLVLLASATAPQVDARQRRRRGQRRPGRGAAGAVARSRRSRPRGTAAVGPVQRGGDDRAVALVAQAVDRVLDVGRREGPEVVGRGPGARSRASACHGPHEAQPTLTGASRSSPCLRE